jgi:hypothetical protein
MPQSRGTSRCQAGTGHCDFSSSQVGPSQFWNWTTELPGHWDRSRGRRDQTAPRMERCNGPKPHLQSHWAQRKSLALRNGILERHWESVDGRSKVDQIVPLWAEWAVCWPNYMVRRSSGCQQDPDHGLAKVLLAPGIEWYWDWRW